MLAVQPNLPSCSRPVKYVTPLFSPITQFRFLNTLLPAAGSATTTFLFTPLALLFNALVFDAVLATLVAAFLIATGLDFAAAVFAGLPARAVAGLVMTVLLVEVEDRSEALVELLAALVVR